jgi:hypothetical protein
MPENLELVEKMSWKQTRPGQVLQSKQTAHDADLLGLHAGQ